MLKSPKNIIILLATILIVGFSIWYLKNRGQEDGKAYKVGLVYLLRHPSIDEGIDGFKSQIDSLEVLYGRHLDVTYANAFGEAKNINGIINSFLQNNCSAIVALTTPCAQIAHRMVNDRPVIFVGVTDPIGAGPRNLAGSRRRKPYGDYQQGT